MILPKAVDPHDLANEYLRGIPLEERRAAGQVYTPPHLAHFVLELAGYDPATLIESATVLDPACGGGIFLEAAVLLLAARFSSEGADLQRPAGRAEFLERVAANIYGVDVDPVACELSRRAVRRAVERVSPGLLPEGYFRENVVEADFLLEDGLEARLPAFAYIVGNPPYVATTRLEDELKHVLRARFTTASGRLDYYTLFMERALPLLAAGGRLAYITPNKYLTSQSAQPLRFLMGRRGRVVAVASFRSHKVFEDAATVPCVTVFERGGEAGAARVLECGEGVTADGEVPVLARYAVPAARFTSRAWDLTKPDLLELARRIQGNHQPLEAFARRVSTGYATGRDGVFVFPADAGIEVEPELLRPAVRGRDLAPHRISDPGLRVLVPYTYDEAGRPSLVDLADYPRARAYLERFRPELEARHCVRVWGKAWYDLHDPVPFDLAAQPKIVVPDVAAHNRFAHDPGRFCPLHSAYYLLPQGLDPHYLAAVLNSAPIEFLVRLNAPVVKDGFSRYRRQFLVTLPIPEADEVTVKTIAESVKAGQLEAAGSLVTALFGLSGEDLALIGEYLENIGGRGRRRT